VEFPYIIKGSSSCCKYTKRSQQDNVRKDITEEHLMNQFRLLQILYRSAREINGFVS